MKKIKNILLISNNFWPENFPINTFVNVLSKKINFTILTGQPNYPKGKIFKNYKWFNYNSEKFYKKNIIYRSPIIPRGDGSNIMRVFNYISFIFFSLFYIPFLSKKKFDHIFVYAPSPVIHAIIGILFKKILKVKMSIWLQDILTSALEIEKNKKSLLITILDKILLLIYKESNILFVQSKSYSKYFKKILPKKKIVYLPNLINRKFDRQKSMKIKNFNFRSFNICYFGNMGDVQEFKTLIKSARIIKNKDINFHLFGEGRKKNFLISEIKKKKISNFFIHDYVDYTLLKKLINKTSVLFLSLKKNKNLNFTAPSKLQLYMYSGKPIIGEINGESKRIIKESKCGLIIKNSDVKNMVKSVEYLYKIRRSKKFKKFGLNGKDYFKKNFSEKKVSEMFMKALEKV